MAGRFLCRDHEMDVGESSQEEQCAQTRAVFEDEEGVRGFFNVLHVGALETEEGVEDFARHEGEGEI